MLGKNIPVYLAAASPGFWRPITVISPMGKELALLKTKNAFEGGKLFKEDDMKITHSLNVRFV